MRYIAQENTIQLFEVEDFKPEQTFGCGQCFRWDIQPDGSWFGIAGGEALRLCSTPEGAVFHCTEEKFRQVWARYFDCGRDYAEIRRSLSEDSFGSRAAAFGAGIRILRQDPWETLCTFIFSQCNNIARIKGIVERFCSRFGAPFEADGRMCHAFPEPAEVALLEPEMLEPLRAGYRAEYIVRAARAVVSGEVDFDELSRLPTAELIRQLTQLRGVGEKVAHCTALFGFGKTDAFPIDVWIRRALSRYYADGFDPSIYGDSAGIVQQYMFHYIRNGIEGRQSADGIPD